MKLRPYTREDFPLIQAWICDARTNAMWCADMFPYPLEAAEFSRLLEDVSRQYGDVPYIAAEDDGTPVGFFCFSVKEETNEGFLKFVVVDNTRRGQGIGTRMLELAAAYAFGTAGADALGLNVFSVNPGARRCYEKVGFRDRSVTENCFVFDGESWSKHNMVLPGPGNDRRTGMLSRDQIAALILRSGFTETGPVPIAELTWEPSVRQICRDNSCRGYGASWACPPAVGTLEECRARVEQYETMLLFSKKYELEDSFDFEGMGQAMTDFKKTVDVLQENLGNSLPAYLLLSNEGCGRCRKCTYPDAPCRFPRQLHHSLEGYGFLVNQLAKQAGIRYNNGPNTVTFFGALLYRTKA